jgi:hypothetical protein
MYSIYVLIHRFESHGSENRVIPESISAGAPFSHPSFFPCLLFLSGEAKESVQQILDRLANLCC